METYDVIVVGAGPAGATAARVCAENGLTTLLLEKEKIPRKKPCAGGLSLGALKELDCDLPEELIERKCYGIHAELGAIKNTFLSETCMAIMVKRAHFDAFLAQRAKDAGSILKTGEACKDIEILKDGVIINTPSTQYRAGIVIGADGFFSRVRRIVRPPLHKKEICYCLIAEVPMKGTEIEKRTRNLVELQYGYNNIGYAWVFPKREYISFGIGGDVKCSKRLKELFLTFLHSKNIDVSRIKIKGCFIPISRFRNRIYTNRIMLIGDAAGLVDCFSGEGIRYALASGKMAAQTAISACRKNDYSKKIMKKYQDMVYRRFKADFIWSRRVSWISFLFPNVIFGTPFRDKDVIGRYLRVLSGDLSFKTFSLWVLRNLPGMILKRFIFNQ